MGFCILSPIDDIERPRCAPSRGDGHPSYTFSCKSNLNHEPNYHYLLISLKKKHLCCRNNFFITKGNVRRYEKHFLFMTLCVMFNKYCGPGAPTPINKPFSLEGLGERNIPKIPTSFQVLLEYNMEWELMEMKAILLRCTMGTISCMD